MAAYVGADTLGIALVMQHVFRSSLRMDLALTCGCFMETQNITITFLPVLFHVRTWMSFFFFTTESFDLSSWNHVVLPAVIWGIVDCCLDFCLLNSFFRVWTSTFPQTTAEDRQNLSWHTSYSSPHSLNLPPSFTSVTRTTFHFLSLNFLPLSYVFLLFSPWVPCSSLNTAGTHQHLYQLWLPSIYSHTHSRRAVTQRSSTVPPTNRQEAPMMQCNPAQTHMWSISWCNSLRSFSSPGNTRLTVLTCSPPTTRHTLTHR